MYSEKQIKSFVKRAPILHEMMRKNRVTWLNPYKSEMKDLPEFPVDKHDMEQAAELWERFAPFLEEVFPETTKTGGRIESPLREIPRMKQLLNETGPPMEGRLFLKCDNALPVAGSIKARGGFYEILHYAEELALRKGMVTAGQDYRCFATPSFKNFFSQFKIGVGSTGNLGLSIGIISAVLGFKVTVYVSADAKSWKKNLLREKGVEVIEFAGDFSKAITTGREETKADPTAYFVDDEDSEELFLGYSVGALRLAQQLKARNIPVDAEHPLLVYSPCGVGGSPGGTAFGLKQIFGDNVHCFFVEPTHCPAVLTGLITREMSRICVQDIGLDNKTEADGLAVGRPSHFATRISKHLVSGIYTLDDDELFTLLAQLKDTEDIFLEPSATAGLIGPQTIAKTDYAAHHRLSMAKATHVVWATGGDLVPSHEREEFYERGNAFALG